MQRSLDVSSRPLSKGMLVSIFAFIALDSFYDMIVAHEDVFWSSTDAVVIAHAAHIVLAWGAIVFIVELVMMICALASLRSRWGVGPWIIAVLLACAILGVLMAGVILHSWVAPLYLLGLGVPLPSAPFNVAALMMCVLLYLLYRRCERRLKNKFAETP